MPKVIQKKETFKKREMVLRNEIDGSFYGKVTGVLGNCVFDVLSLHDNDTRRCKLRKGAKKTGKIETNTIVLFCLRDFQTSDGTADIHFVYTNDESKYLERKGEIEKIVNKDIFDEEEEDIGIDFDEL